MLVFAGGASGQLLWLTGFGGQTDRWITLSHDFSPIGRLKGAHDKIIRNSAKLKLTPGRLDELRKKHGAELEQWWQERFGHAFDALTESEARYLVRSPNADTIRNRLVAAE